MRRVGDYLSRRLHSRAYDVAAAAAAKQTATVRLVDSTLVCMRTTASADLAGVTALIAAWRTNNRVTSYLVENLPPDLWDRPVPGVPRRRVRTIAAHIHNARCGWINSMGAAHGVAVPKSVDARRVPQAELPRAFARSSEGNIALIRLGASRGGRVPSAVWQNFPTDLVHFLTYFVAHEAHHRGQLIMLARQLGCRLPAEVTAGVWQWKTRARE